MTSEFLRSTENSPQEAERLIMEKLERISLRASLALAVRLIERNPAFVKRGASDPLRQMSSFVGSFASEREVSLLTKLKADEEFASIGNSPPVLEAIKCLWAANKIGFAVLEKKEVIERYNLMVLEKKEAVEQNLDSQSPYSKDIRDFLSSVSKAIAISLESAGDDWKNMHAAFMRDFSYMEEKHFKLSADKVGAVVPYVCENISEFGPVWDVRELPESWKALNRQLCNIAIYTGDGPNKVLENNPDVPDVIVCAVGTSNSAISFEDAARLITTTKDKSHRDGRHVQVNIYAPDLPVTKKMELRIMGSNVFDQNNYKRPPTDVFEFEEMVAHHLSREPLLEFEAYIQASLNRN